MQSYRRQYLDQWLMNNAALYIKGKVLDIGGKKQNKRGSFDPKTIKTECWDYLNTDSSTSPDILANATKIPVKNEYYDTVLLCELLEHLEHPEYAIAEAFRVMKPQGCCVITIPFLVPIHPDPSDFARFTPDKLKRMLEKHGFNIKTLSTMGGLFSVISDLLRFAYVNNRKEYKKTSKIALKTLLFISRKIQAFDKQSSPSSSNITTGYGIIATKP
ncbi:methyltransferase domain-containing protein [Prosthecochloris sp. SCSIO W1102]|uniref:class I SAM-dependent methyltransferase n=1 Tax=Prosthecochloris sp. SCSIO W1102 TaxID=2992243 RepID=UPI00223D508D|nr:methyltransferase domain-containing protein [Prosthecochloris sp. SCSIO W1102]UZJ39123.1 methyltransferase domain-containing protein [Prosthecochloris sp. SCSIO W1102]